MGNFIKKMAFKYRDNKIAIILVRPFYRLINKYKEYKRRSFYHNNAEELLIQLKKTLDSNNVFFWLEFGTLLGAYRDKDFIKHDLDLDIAVFYENSDKIRKILSKGGFKLLKEYKVGTNGFLGFEETYEYMHVTVDVFYFHKENEMMYCNTFSQFEDEYHDMSVYQVKQISVPYNGFSTITFKGMIFNAPKDIEKHLQCHYGKNFMIPDSKFDYRKEATNIHWYKREERVGIYKTYK